MIPHDKLYIHMPFFRLIEDLDEFCRLGQNCEIYIDATALDSLTEKHIEKINIAFDKYNLKKSVHSCFMDLNPGSLDSRIKKISIDRISQCIDMCPKLGADRIVIHTHFSPIFYGKRNKQWSDNIINALKDLYKYAGERKVTIAAENSIDDTSWPTLEIVEKIKGIKACFDIAHYHVFSPLGWEGELAKYPSDSIIEVHLSDNDGSADEHLALGSGSIDFKKFFNILEDRKIEPYFTIEPHDMEGLLRGLEYLRKLRQANSYLF